jgi:hypothetical protein
MSNKKVKCPNCGYDTPRDLIYCVFCDARLPDSAAREGVRKDLEASR